MATAVSFQDPSGGKSADILEGRFLVSSEIADAPLQIGQLQSYITQSQYGWPMANKYC